MRAIRDKLADERGHTVMELLMVTALSIVVLGAVLAFLDTFQRTTQRNQVLNESQDRTRQATDQLARELRNLASPTAEQPQALDKATSYDLVFQTVDHNGPNAGQNMANVRRVRYCLDDSSGVAAQKLWMQTQTWTTAATPAIPSTAGCPDSAWGNQSAVAVGVTNRTQGRDRPLFAFNSSTLTAINSIVLQTWARPRSTPTPEPTDGLLRTQVFLRNQNQQPVAQFTATPVGNRHVLLNGSSSDDVEGDELSYQWYVDGTTKLGSGITLDAVISTTGLHDVRLEVFDAAGLKGTLTQEVNVL